MKTGKLILLVLLMLAAVTVAILLLLLPSPDTEPPAETASSLPVPTQPEATVTAPTQTEAPTTQAPETETEPVDPALSRAEDILKDMSLYEKLCQLLILSPDTITGISPTREADSISRAALEKFPVCGFSFSQENLKDREQTIHMLSGFQEMSKLPLFFALDEEGGTVWRVMGNSAMGTTRLDSMYSYKDLGTETAFDNAKTIAKDLTALGFNLDFAPVADVWSNPSNTIIGKRAYSDDFSQAALLVNAAAAGFRDGGIACTLKHFPGHGSTVQDSHKNLAVVERTAEELREAELLPFRAGIEAGADMIMVGHLLVEDLDPENPATLSYAIVTELLRGELGYNGVVITDSLGMGALSQYGEATRCRKAIEAGCDILLGITEPEDTLNALLQDVENGTLTEARIDESVLRILLLKIDRRLIPLAP